MRSITISALLFCLLGLAGQSLLAQRFSFLTNGPIRSEIPFITAETFGFYVVPLQQGAFPENIRLRWLDGEGNYSEWHEFEQYDHAEPGYVISDLGYGKKRQWTDFELDMPASGPVNLIFFDPGRTDNNIETSGTTLAAAACFKPAVEARNDWCPAGNCPVDATPSFTNVTHLIVHHSAGVNQSNDWAGIVRIIWDFHVNGNGWDDIGYNYLVDPNGVIYVGRGNDVRGAHFCGNNSNTMGTCLLGTFTTQLPTLEARESLARLLAWKCEQNNIDPTEVSFHAGSNENLNNLAAHRQGCSTECPGQAFFELFGAFRQAVADELLACLLSDVSEPGWAEQITVSPNPSSEAVKITGLPQGADIELYSITGELLLSTKASQVASVEARINEAKAGIYVLKVENDGQVYVQQVVRQ